MRSVREYKVVLSSEEVLTFGGFKTIDDLIIYKLHKQFVGICYKNSVVTKILNIERRSAVLQEKLSFIADMYVNVIFNVECVTFAKNDIISCCKVSKIQPDGRIDAIPEISDEFENLNNNLSVKLKNDNLEPKKVLIYLAIRPNEKLRHVKVGDRIPAIVSEVNYRTMTPYVVIRALPFTIQPKRKIYKILPSVNKNKNLPISITLDNSIVNDLDELDDDDDSKSNASFRRKRLWYERSVYSNILESINDIYNECMDSKYAKHAEFKHFLKELYPYAKEEGKKIKWYEVNVDDIVEIKPEDLERSAKIITNTTEINMDEVIPIRQKEFLIKVLNQQLDFIKTVKEFALHYSVSATFQ
jgi:hypothetical protein